MALVLIVLVPFAMGFLAGMVCGCALDRWALRGQVKRAERSLGELVQDLERLRSQTAGKP